MRRWTPYLLLGVTFVVASIIIARVLATVGSSLFDDWKLVFQQLQSWQRWIALSLACGTAVSLVAVLHQYERSLISPTLGRVLLVLRLCLILVVFLALLEPVWSWSYEEQQTGRVAVALDVSQSMETRDTHARLMEKLQWAQAMGVFGNDEARQRADRWIDQLNRGLEPEWVSAEEEPDPQIRDQKSVMRGADVANLLETLTDYSRQDLAARTLVSQPRPFLTELETFARVDVSLFAEDHVATDQATIKKLIDGGEVKLHRNTSALVASMQAAIETDSETPLVGLILLTDGRDTSTVDRKQLVQRLAGLGVPIHTVMVGSERRPQDLAVAHIDAPESVFKGDTPLIHGSIQTFGYENKEIQVFLDWLDDPQRDPLSTTILADGSLTEVQFPIEGLELGRHHFRLRTEVLPDELRDDNNSRDLAVNVVDDRAQVLLVDEEGRWEFRYLSSALERDKRVALQQVLFDQPYMSVLNKPFFPRRLDAIGTADDTATRYADFDCVIIGDVSPGHMPVAEWQALNKYVRDEGGTLILTAGKNDFPKSYRGTLVDELLPITDLAVIDLRGLNQALPPTQRGFHLSITPDGERLAMFQLGDDILKSRLIWSELPGHSWGIAGRVKGGASVFASALKPGQRISLEQERNNAIIAQHFVGTGQVMWVGIDSTWRWRYRTGDEFHHRFWGQVIRWAVSFKTSSGNGNVRLGLTPPVIDESQSTLVRARWEEKFFRDHPDLTAVAIVTANNGSGFQQRVELQRNESIPFTHETELKGLDPGEYRVSIEVPNIDLNGPAPEELLIVNELVSQELVDISADRPLLEEIAAATGGQFVQLHEIHELSDLFADSQMSISKHEEIPLWSHWTVLVIFCTIAMTEWIMRKLNGLP